MFRTDGTCFIFLRNFLYSKNNWACSIWFRIWLMFWEKIGKWHWLMIKYLFIFRINIFLNHFIKFYFFSLQSPKFDTIFRGFFQNPLLLEKSWSRKFGKSEKTKKLRQNNKSRVKIEYDCVWLLIYMKQMLLQLSKSAYSYLKVGY